MVEPICRSVIEQTASWRKGLLRARLHRSRRCLGARFNGAWPGVDSARSSASSRLSSRAISFRRLRTDSNVQAADTRTDSSTFERAAQGRNTIGNAIAPAIRSGAMHAGVLASSPKWGAKFVLPPVTASGFVEIYGRLGAAGGAQRRNRETSAARADCRRTPVLAKACLI